MPKQTGIIKSIVQELMPTFGSWVFGSTHRVPEKYGDSYFYPLSSSTWNQLVYLEQFNIIPEVNATINMKARAFSSARLKVVNKTGTEKKNDYVNQLLRRPNWFQAQKEFLRQTKLWHEIYGNEYLYTLMPVGGSIDNVLESMRVSALFTLPPNLMKVCYEDSAPYYAHTKTPKIEYELSFAGKRTNIDPRLIIHLNDNRVNVTEGVAKDILQGESKMLGLTPALNNIRMAYESRGIILKYRGALGILSNATTDVAGSVELDPKEIERIQNSYKKYGSLSHQQQLIITSANLKWQQMMVNPDRLGLYQETEEDFNKILDAYGVPAELFVRSKGSTFENQRQARKGFYTETIIPEMTEWIMAVNDAIMKDSNFEIVADFSHLPIFQDDIKHRADAVNATVAYLSKLLSDNQITNEEYRAELLKVGLGDGKPIPVTPPSEDNVASETQKAQAQLRGSVGGVSGILSVQTAVSAGTCTYDSAIAILTIIFGFGEEDAKEIVGEPITQEPTTEEVTEATEETEELGKMVTLKPRAKHIAILRLAKRK